MLSKRAMHAALLLVLVTGPVAVGVVRQVGAAALQVGAVALQDDVGAAAKIENATSAAPPAIADDATVLDNELDDGGKFVVLREGTNGWYCSPDALGTPGMDPWCYDQTWLDWAYAFVAQEEPDTVVPGFAYMLQGGSDASNTDPFATEPAEGEEWVTSPPHVMLLMPGDLDQTVLSTDHGSGGPYIMWAGTPYEHVMMPVAEGEHDM